MFKVDGYASLPNTSGLRWLGKEGQALMRSDTSRLMGVSDFLQLGSLPYL